MFIFLDLEDGLFGGEEGGRRDRACTLPWQILEWNSEIRAKAGGWGWRECGTELLSLTPVLGDDVSS